MDMRHLAERFLSEEDREKVRRAVAEAEATTSAEIVPMIVSASHHYPKAETLGAMVFALLAGVFICLVFSSESMWTFVALFCLCFFCFHELIKRVPTLKKPFISRERIEEEVAEGALAAFYRQGLYGTKDRTGILIYVSVFERKVWILADKGVDARIPQGAWNGLAASLTAGIRYGRPGDALAAAVRKCGELTAPLFPRRPNDANELGDLIIGQ